MYENINLAFFCTTKKRFGRNDYYKHTLDYLSKQIDLSYFNLIANIKSFKGEEGELEEFVSVLKGYGFDILINQSDINPHSKEQYFEYINGYKQDIINVFQDNKLHKADYTFWLEDDSPSVMVDDSNDLTSTIRKSIDLLESDYRICSVYHNRGIFHPKDVQESSPEASTLYEDIVIHNRDFTFQPNISRTKDLYYAANFLERHYNQIGNIHNENAFSICLREIFSKDYSIACFEPTKVCSLHCAHDNFESIEKEKESFINDSITNENN